MQSVTEDCLVLDKATVPTGRGTLHIDCTSQWIYDRPALEPIWSPGRIALQPVGQVCTGPGEFNVPFQAALIARCEAVYPKDEERKNQFCTPAHWADTTLEGPELSALPDEGPTWDLWHCGEVDDHIREEQHPKQR